MLTLFQIHSSKESLFQQNSAFLDPWSRSIGNEMIAVIIGCSV